MTEQTQPTDAEHIPHTCGGFSGAFFAQHKRMPSAQEIWDAAIRSYRDLNRTPAGAGEVVAWEAIVPGYIKYVTQSRYEKFSATARSGYKPYKCSNCAAPQPTQAQAGAVPFNKAQRTNLFNNRDLASAKNMGVKLTLAEWHRIVQYIESAHGIKGADHA
jgi:hypothetical protein